MDRALTELSNKVPVGEEEYRLVVLPTTTTTKLSVSVGLPEPLEPQSSSMLRELGGEISSSLLTLYPASSLTSKNWRLPVLNYTGGSAHLYGTTTFPTSRTSWPSRWIKPPRICLRLTSMTWREGCSGVLAALSTKWSCWWNISETRREELSRSCGPIL